MRIIPTASCLPRCVGRLAHSWLQSLALVVVGAMLGPATASGQLSPTESELHLVDPAGRFQQRQVSELRILDGHSQNDWESVVQLCAQWQERLSDVRVALENQYRLAMQEDQSNGEEIGAGEPDPCFVSHPLSTVSVNIAKPAGELPEDVAAKCRYSRSPVVDTRLTCGWAVYEKHWAASCSHHRPLYFEEINAERYGYTPSHCLQPFISAGRFLVTIPAMPYLIAASAPRDCVYTLGHYRPGDCVPYRWHHPPRVIIAGVYEAAVIVGLVALVP